MTRSPDRVDAHGHLPGSGLSRWDEEISSGNSWGRGQKFTETMPPVEAFSSALLFSCGTRRGAKKKSRRRFVIYRDSCVFLLYLSSIERTASAEGRNIDSRHGYPSGII